MALKRLELHDRLALAFPGHQQTRWSQVLLKVWDADPREELVPTELTQAVTLDVPASRTVSHVFRCLQAPVLWYCDIKT